MAVGGGEPVGNTVELHPFLSGAVVVGRHGDGHHQPANQHERSHGLYLDSWRAERRKPPGCGMHYPAAYAARLADNDRAGTPGVQRVPP